MKTDASTRDGCAVVTASGEVDLASAGALAEALRRVPAGIPIIVDLTGITFMDSSGLHVILHVQRDAHDSGVPFIVVPSPEVARLFDFAGVQAVTRMSPTLADALTAVLNP